MGYWVSKSDVVVWRCLELGAQESPLQPASVWPKADVIGLLLGVSLVKSARLQCDTYWTCLQARDNPHCAYLLS